MSELAALTGMGERHQQSLYPGRDTSGSVRSNSRSQAPPTRPYDPNEDDPIDHAMSVRSGGSEHQSHYIVAPSIQVRSEFASIVRTNDSSQPLTCIVIVELPGKRVLGPTPGPLLSDSYSAQPHSTPTLRSPPTTFRSTAPDYSSPDTYPQEHPTSPVTSPVSLRPNHHQNLIDPYTPPQVSEEDSPFRAITEDLRNRIIDWKGHPLSGLGPLQMYDLLSVRRDAIVREFFVYLFKEAIICVVEEKKRGLGRLLSNAGVGEGGSVSVGNQGQTKGVLRLKGRIYIRHIKNVTDTSVSHEMSLTIDMEDERLDSFILIFRERSSLETWKNQIQNLVTVFQRQSVFTSPRQPPPIDDAGLEEFGGSRKAARMLSGSTGTTSSTYDSLLQSSSRSTMSSNTSHGSAHLGMGGTLRSNHSKLATLDEGDESARYNTPVPSISLVTPHTSSGPSNSLAPLLHPPMDIIVVISVPPPHATLSTATLKNRVIKTSLDFVIGSLGIKDRLSIVTFEVGPGGKVRKTPFLNVGRAQSRARLAKFVDGIGSKTDDDSSVEDEFLVRGSLEEKSDVVTAVNHSMYSFTICVYPCF
jgi:Pleckstrin homology domain